MLLFPGNLIMSSRHPEHGACYPGDIPVPRVPLPPQFCSSPSSHPSTGVPAQPSCQRSPKLRPLCPARQPALAGRRRRPARPRPYRECPPGHRLLRSPPRCGRSLATPPPWLRVTHRHPAAAEEAPPANRRIRPVRPISSYRSSTPDFPSPSTRT